MRWLMTKEQFKHGETFLTSYNAATDLMDTFLKAPEIMHLFPLLTLPSVIHEREAVFVFISIL